MKIVLTDKMIRLAVTHKSRYFICLIIMLVCLSCQHREAYYRFSELKDAKWSSGDTLVFNIDSTTLNTNTAYDISVELVNNTDYPYQNLWLYIQDDLEGNKFSSCQKQYEMIDHTGKWYGSGFGSIFQLSLMHQKRIVFTQKQNRVIKIVHGMRDEPLVGIEKVGIKIALADMQE